MFRSIVEIMEVPHMLRIFYLVFIVCLHTSFTLQVKKYPFLMPNVHPYRDELYLCTPIKVVPNESFYIVGFEPKASMNMVHHMMLFGCSAPGTKDPYWNCGEMAVSQNDNHLRKSIPCADGSHVLYAWARDAKTLELPQDVGFQVGVGTKISYLVLQVHYSKKFPDHQNDNSGIYLMYTSKPRSKLAGVVLLGTGGSIPPKSLTNMEVNCRINEEKTIYPFAYRTHTHSLGKVVSGYKIRRDKLGNDHWTLLGKRDPLTPQMFYPTLNKDYITYGDELAARCTMESHRNTTTYVGPTNDDEMCNFYLMYYVQNGAPLEMKYCINRGPPDFHWSDPENYFNHIPNDASTL